MACFFNLCGGRDGIFVGLWLRMTFLEFHPKTVRLEAHVTQECN